MQSIGSSTDNIFALLMDLMNSQLEDFTILSQIQEGDKIGLTADKHFYISGGSTLSYLSELYQKAYRSAYGDTLVTTMNELKLKISSLNTKLDYFNVFCKDMFASTDLYQINEFKKKLTIDLSVLRAAQNGLKTLALTYQNIEEKTETEIQYNVDDINKNEKCVNNLSEKMKFLIEKIDETISLSDAEAIIEVINCRVQMKSEDHIGIFREGGSESKIKELMTKIEEKKEKPNFELKDTSELTSVLKRLMKYKINIINEGLKSEYLSVGNLANGEEKIKALKEVFLKISQEKKEFVRKLCQLCENIYQKPEIKMDASNLTISLALSFFQDSNEKVVKDIKNATNAFFILITNYREILI